MDPDLRGNSTDTMNTNIALTVREVAPKIPIVGLADEEDSIDILELSGCTHVLPLHRKLADRLANRINSGHAESHVIGTIRSFQTLQIADFSVHNTPLVGRKIGEVGLREATGVNIVAVWERGRLLPAKADIVLSKDSVPVGRRNSRADAGAGRLPGDLRHELQSGLVNRVVNSFESLRCRGVLTRPWRTLDP